MGYSNDSALILLKVLLEPINTLGIKMVGRFVEQEHIGFLKKQAAESHTTSLTTREVGDGPVARRTTQGAHGAVELGVHVPCVGGVDDVLHLSLTLHQLIHFIRVAIVFLKTELLVYLLIFGKGIVGLLHSILHVLLDGLGLVERRVLWQIAHSVARAPHHLSLSGLLNTGNDFHQSRFTGTIKTNDTDLRSIEEREVNVLQYLFLVLGYYLGYPHHRKYYLLVIYCCHFLFYLLSGNFLSAKVMIFSDITKCFSNFWVFSTSTAIYST